LRTELATELPDALLSRTLRIVEVYFTPEQEAQLAQIATKAGTDAERLVKDVVLRLLEDEARFNTAAPELPVLHLGNGRSPPARHLQRCPLSRESSTPMF